MPEHHKPAWWRRADRAPGGAGVTSLAGGERLAAAVLPGWIALLSRTLRQRVVGDPRPLRWIAGGRGLILVTPHNSSLLTVAHLRARTPRWTHRRYTVLVSASADGELIARGIEGAGGSTVRGSTSRRARASMKALLRATRGGAIPVLTPDGPRGPKYSVADGVAWLARAAELPVVPVACRATAAVVAPSWDRFVAPLPLGALRAAWGAPMVFDDSESTEAARGRLERALRAVVRRAEGAHRRDDEPAGLRIGRRVLVPLRDRRLAEDPRRAAGA